MNPIIGKIAFTMAILFILLSLLPLPYLLSYVITKGRLTASFIVDVIALCFSLIFLFLIIWEIRRQVKKEIYSE